MEEKRTLAPESSAVRVALWRALHLEVDSLPHILEDKIGLQLAQPSDDWRQRPDMHPQGTSGFRAAIVARARFMDDLVEEQERAGVLQYVILGAGLDTFAQRKTGTASRISIFEIDQPGPQAWKRERLIELGLGIPDCLKLVPVDFEAGASWWEQLVAAGFDKDKPAVVSSTGVSMYISKEATAATLRQMSGLASGSTLAMTFLLPADLIELQDRPGLEMSAKGARASGTPFISFYSPDEILEMARQAGFRQAEHVSGAELARRYFSERTDGLRPSSGEDFLIAST